MEIGLHEYKATREVITEWSKADSRVALGTYCNARVKHLEITQNASWKYELICREFPFEDWPEGALCTCRNNIIGNRIFDPAKFPEFWRLVSKKEPITIREIVQCLEADTSVDGLERLICRIREENGI